jgi:rhodanese-related sulfurtransferase
MLALMTRTITPEELKRRYLAAEPVELIDVRTPAEFRALHVEFARNVPLDQLDVHVIRKARSGKVDEPLYLICQKGGRGKQACEMLTAAGIANVFNVTGGTQACELAGLPIAFGRQALSLERQVRIAAGSLVFVGSILAYLVHPYWTVVPAFVGAGLVFAGITDTCGMGLMLARMPWNQGGYTRPDCAVEPTK